MILDTVHTKNGVVKTFKNVVPLRFIMKDGKRILQHPFVCVETQEVVWTDVPLVELENE